MKNFVGVSLPIAVALIIAQLPGMAIGLVYGLMTRVIAEYVDPSVLGILGGVVQGSSSLIGLLVGSYMAGGIASFVLKVARGQPVSFGDVFSGGKYFGKMFVAGIGFFIAVAIGAVLCIVPGYIVALGLSLYSYVVVDQGLSGVDALKKSWEMTKGHKVTLFLMALLSILVVIAGAIACGIGVLLGSMPVLLLANAYAYLRIKGEEPRLAQ